MQTEITSKSANPQSSNSLNPFLGLDQVKKIIDTYPEPDKLWSFFKDATENIYNFKDEKLIHENAHAGVLNIVNYIIIPWMTCPRNLEENFAEGLYQLSSAGIDGLLQSILVAQACELSSMEYTAAQYQVASNGINFCYNLFAIISQHSSFDN